VHVEKHPLQIHFMHLDNKETSWISQICCIISVVFSTKHCWFQNFIKFFFLLQIIFSFLIKHELKFKYPACCLKVNFAELRYLRNQVFTPLSVSTNWNEKHAKELTIWQKDVVWTYNMKTSIERFCCLYMCTCMYMYVCV